MARPGRPAKQIIESQGAAIVEDARKPYPCRAIIHYLDAFNEEVVCEDYCIEDEMVYLSTAKGRQVVPLANVRKLEVVKL